MRLGEFKNARSITNSTLNIIEENNLEVVSMKFIDVECGMIKMNFTIKSNNCDKNKIVDSIAKEFRYNDWDTNFEIFETPNYITFEFYIK